MLNSHYCKPLVPQTSTEYPRRGEVCTSQKDTQPRNLGYLRSWKPQLTLEGRKPMDKSLHLLRQRAETFERYSKIPHNDLKKISYSQWNQFNTISLCCPSLVSCFTFLLALNSVPYPQVSKLSAQAMLSTEPKIIHTKAHFSLFLCLKESFYSYFYRIQTSYQQYKLKHLFDK